MTMCSGSQNAVSGCVAAVMCTVASLTPDPEFMSAHVVGKVGERGDTETETNTMQRMIKYCVYIFKKGVCVHLTVYYLGVPG